MKYQEAEELKPTFEGLINVPVDESVVIGLIVSYIENAVAKEHFSDLKRGMGHRQVMAYENDYTLWAVLADDTFVSVRYVIFGNKVEDLYESAKLLP